MELIKLLVKLIQSRVLFFNHNLRRRSGGDLLELFTDNLASIFKDKFDTTWQSVGSPEFSLRLKNRNKFFIVDKAWSFISVPSLSSVIISPLVPSCPPPHSANGKRLNYPLPPPRHNRLTQSLTQIWLARLARLPEFVTQFTDLRTTKKKFVGGILLVFAVI